MEMERNALLKIIKSDIQELELLISTFIDEENIPEGYIKLAQKKSSSISEKLSLITSSKSVSSNSTERTISSETVKPGPKASTKIEKTITQSENKQASEKVIIEIEDEKVAGEPKEVAKVKQPEQEKVIQPTLQPKEEIKTPPIDKPKTKTVSAPQKPKSNAVIGEVLGKENKSLNEQLAANSKKSDANFQSAVSDLKKAIGINDRFLFQRELFKNSSELYDQIIEQLNNMPNLEAANSFLKSNFNWDSNDETVSIFLDIVKRRFKN